MPVISSVVERVIEAESKKTLEKALAKYSELA